MKNATLRERIRYAFDNTMSRGPGGLIRWLALASLTLVLAVSLLRKLTPAGEKPLVNHLVALDLVDRDLLHIRSFA